MTVSSTTTRWARRRERRLRVLLDHDLTAILAVAAFTALALAVLSRQPTTVDVLRIDNPTEYDLVVTVRASEGDARLPVGTVAREDELRSPAVIDQGGTWIFSARGQGLDGGDWTMSRTQLEAQGWTVTVPDAIAARLREQGAPPTP